MHDGNMSDDLRQQSLGQVKALEYDYYDINEYHFRTLKLHVGPALVYFDFYSNSNL
jgi:hypothetical protein